MNDIPLHKWDMMQQWLPPMIREKAKELHEGNSLSTTVCVAKEAARQFKDQKL